VIRLAAVRTRNHDADVPAHPDALVQGTPNDALEALERTGHSGARVRERERVGRCGEDGDLVDWGFVGMCGEETEDALEALFVGDEYLGCDAWKFVYRGHDLGCASLLSLDVWTLVEIVHAQIWCPDVHRIL